MTIPQAHLQPPGDFRSSSPRSGTLSTEGRGLGHVGESPEGHACHSSGGTCRSLMMTMTTWTCKRGVAPAPLALSHPTFLQPQSPFHPDPSLSPYLPSATHPIPLTRPLILPPPPVPPPSFTPSLTQAHCPHPRHQSQPLAPPDPPPCPGPQLPDVAPTPSLPLQP